MSTVITDKQVKSHLSANLRAILGSRGLTGAWLMKALNLKEGTFYPVYNGEVVPRLAVTARIAEVLGVTVDDLLKKPAPEPQNATRKKASPSS